MLRPENPSIQAIIKGCREIGSIEVSEHSYYRAEDTIIPFDALAEHLTGAGRDWCVQKAGA